jgi:uncharacterized protein YbjT (DUF2867 family)
MRIAIAGATGFVGRALHARLREHHQIIALSRSTPNGETQDGTLWRHCNLFNLESVEHAVRGCDAAFYLVHSMQPGERLVQGSFADLDLLCADNFGRAARHAKLQHVVYLGGIVPEDTKLSEHLRSRLEVEEALAAYGVPCAALRAAVIVGADGSSFDIMERLTRRLPGLAVPRHLRSTTQPIALDDVVALLEYCVDHPEVAGQHYDIGGPDVMTYSDMLRVVGKIAGTPKPGVDLPVDIPLTATWVSMVTGQPSAFVAPLVESLQHDMVVHDGNTLQRKAGVRGMSFRTAVRRAIAQERKGVHVKNPRPIGEPPSTGPGVLSVQRMDLPEHGTVGWAVDEFARWLSGMLGPHARVQRSRGQVVRAGADSDDVWIDLKSMGKRDRPRRMRFAVSGKLMGRDDDDRVFVEFREVLGGRCLLSLMQGKVPRSPRYVMRWVQAAAHKRAMGAFAAHLQHHRQ